MPSESSVVASIKPQARSRVGNGAEILSGVDGRSAVMRRYRELYGQLIADQGGDVSEARDIISRRAAALAAWCEQVEAAMANGETIDIQAYTTAANSLRRLLADVGLERRPRDVTPDLRSYLAQRQAEA